MPPAVPPAPPPAADFRLRLAAPGDAGALAAFAARTFRATYAPPFGTCAPADVEAYVAASFGTSRQRAELADPAGRTLLLESRDGLAGYAQLRAGSPPEVAVADFAPATAAEADASVPPPVPLPPGPVAWVELARLYVDRAWHGRGLAAALLDEAERVAHALAATGGAGAPWLWLSVYARNPRAVAFYRRAGFGRLGRGTFRMGADVQDDWILGRRLADVGRAGTIPASGPGAAYVSERGGGDPSAGNFRSAAGFPPDDGIVTAS